MQRYPEMIEEYRKRCKAEPRQFNLGDCWPWKADDRPWVFNLGTQEGYWRSRVNYSINILHRFLTFSRPPWLHYME